MTIVYRNCGFNIGTIYIYIESKPLMYKLKDELDINLNQTNADDCITQSGQNNRIIRERV